MRNERDGGFTMVELVIALTVIAVGVVGIISVFSSSFGVAVGNTNRARATSLAVQKLETLRATPFSTLTTVAPADPMTTVTTMVGGMTYSISSSLTASAVPSCTGCKDAVVAVSWTDGAGTHSVNQTTTLYSVGGATPTSTTIVPAPSGPLSVVASIPAGIAGGAIVTWTPPASLVNLHHWVVESSTDNFVTRTVGVSDQIPPEATSFPVSGLAANTTYQFRVTAVSASGSASTPAYSNTVTVPPQTITTPCQYGTLAITPSAVRRATLADSLLTSTPVVSVAASGTCAALFVTYHPTADTSRTLTLTPPPSGGVWSASFPPTDMWDVGYHEVDLYDTSGYQRGFATLLVCEPNAASC